MLCTNTVRKRIIQAMTIVLAQKNPVWVLMICNALVKRTNKNQTSFQLHPDLFFQFQGWISCSFQGLIDLIPHGPPLPGLTSGQDVPGNGVCDGCEDPVQLSQGGSPVVQPPRNPTSGEIKPFMRPPPFILSFSSRESISNRMRKSQEHAATC